MFIGILSLDGAFALCLYESYFLSQSVSGTSQKSFYVDHCHRVKDGRSKDQHLLSVTKANVISDQPPLCLGEPETATKVDWDSGFTISQPTTPPPGF